MSKIEPPDKWQQVEILKEAQRKLQLIRAYIVGTGSEEYARMCEEAYRLIALVINGIDEEKEDGH